jgi:hypothetical protein
VPVPSFYHDSVERLRHLVAVVVVGASAVVAVAVVVVQAVVDRPMDSLEDDPAVDLPFLLEDPDLSLP